MNNPSQLVIFGEVLMDCFANGKSVLGGAPFNVAWHCQAFGLSPLLITRIGDDAEGNHIRTAMQQWGLNINGLQVDPTLATGKVMVTFQQQEPCYDIVYPSAWDHIQATQIPKLNNNTLLYYGSLATRDPISAQALEHLKQQSSGSNFIDINLREPWWDISTLEKLLSSAHFLKLNDLELQLLIKKNITLAEKIASLFKQYPIELIVITQGEKGAVAFTRDGKEYPCNIEKTTDIIDTVGAGDSFSSVLLLGKIKGWPLSVTLERAQKFAAAIVTIQGATSENKEFYQTFISDWNL